MSRLSALTLILLIPVLASADIQSARDAQARGDLQAAANEYRRLADLGDPAAQVNLGYMYYVGEGVNQSYPEAVNWYRKAAVQGERDAQYNLAVAYAFGEGVKQDLKEAATWYRRAAEQGHMVAQYSLGLSNLYGEGVPQNSTEAQKWFKQSSDQGYVRAQVQLGSMYHTGDGVPQDMTEAVKWYRLAADKGDAVAQYNLGSLYRSGKGVPQDYTQARRWFRMAADQGYAAAQSELASLERATAAAARSGTALRPTPAAPSQSPAPTPATTQVTPPPPVTTPAPPVPAATPAPAPATVAATPPPAPATTTPAPERQEMFSVDKDELLTLEAGKTETTAAPEATVAPAMPTAETPVTETAPEMEAPVADAGTPATETTVTPEGEAPKQSGVGGFFRRLFKPTPAPETPATETATTAATEVTEPLPEDTAAAPAPVDDGASDLMAMEDIEPQTPTASVTDPEATPAMTEIPAQETESTAMETSPEQPADTGTANDEAISTSEPEVEKKPGFFSRLFGRKNTEADTTPPADEATETPVPESKLASPPATETQPPGDTAAENEVTQAPARVPEPDGNDAGWPVPGQDTGTAPVTENAHAAPADTGTEVEASADATDATAPGEKKRGFFGRLFGGKKTAEPAVATETTETPAMDEASQPEPATEVAEAAPVPPPMPPEDTVAMADADMEPVTETTESEIQEDMVSGDAASAGSNESEESGFFGRLFGRKKQSEPDATPAADESAVATAETPAEPPVATITDDETPIVGEIDPALRAGALTDIRDGNYERALATLRGLADQGDPESQFQLATLLHQGLGTERDHAAAAAWYRRAGQRGFAEAQYSLGNMYLMGEGVEQDDAQATAWYEKAAAQGHDAARHNLENLRRMAEQGEEPAEEPAGDIEEPEAVEGDATTTAEEQPQKKSFFGRLFGAKEDTAEAAVEAPADASATAPAPAEADPELTAPVAETPVEPAPDPGAKPETDDATAPAAEEEQDAGKKRGFFGRLFGGKDGPAEATESEVAPDAPVASPDSAGTEATSEKPAPVADAEAAYQNGLALVMAQGGPELKQEAFKLFQTAAEQGHALAQYRVGVSYAYGEGVEQNASQAAEWYRRAAVQGYATAQRNLALMYMNGEGVEQNRSLALAWFMILADTGNPMDQKRRESLHKELNDAERDQADKLMQEIRSRIASGK